DPLANHVAAVVHPGLGVTLAVQDAAGLKTAFDYDTFGRLRARRDPSGAATSVTYSRGSEPYSVIEARSGNDGSTSSRAFDRRGRNLRTAFSGFDAKTIVVDRTFDAKGRVTTVTRPRIPALNDTSYYESQVTYDNLGRILSVAHDDPNKSKTFS